MSQTPPAGIDERSLDHVEEWLADRALLGRGDAGTMPRRFADHLDEGLDLAAAALDLALFPPREVPPAALRARVTARLREVAAAANAAATEPRAIGASSTASTASTALTALTGGFAASRSGSTGWWVAAAAIAIALLAWLPSLDPRGASPKVGESGESAIAALRQHASTKVVACACTDDPLCRADKVCGEVLWNAERQEGFLRLRGVAANDPRELQYQLWIVDSSRDARYPVDGGVFDVPAGEEEILVPIKAAVPVRDAALFAVSVEKPGGTVVSERRFVAVAPVS